MTKVTYLIGAGASAHSLPVVNSLTDRFKFFCAHMDYFIEKNGGETSESLADRYKLIENISQHYTVDTYAKKLFLQNPDLRSNKAYQYLTNYLSAFFIYEQLVKNVELDYNIPLKFGRMDGAAYGLVGNWGKDLTLEKESEIRKLVLSDLDYRYESFFASILKHGYNNEIVMPSEINIVSWNYDAQFEKAYMNFTGCNYNEALNKLNYIGLTDGELLRKGESAFIKLNGTAGFYGDDGTFGDLFDFNNHSLDERTFGVFKRILNTSKCEYNNSLRFAWEKTKPSEYAIECAKKVLGESEVIVVIGYSFPYFNREIDREIFSDVHLSKIQGKYHEQIHQRLYIQAPGECIESIVNRFHSIHPHAHVERFTETDQFLIPNEL